ncbi:MAG: YlbF family regulator [Syntrophomonas sp.]
MTANLNPYDKAHELARSITSNEAYIDYCAAKKKIDDNPEWKEKILNLRQRQMEINKAQIFGEEMPKETVGEVALEFAKLNRNKEIAEFFRTEGVFIRLFNDLQEIIQKAIQDGFEE